MLESTLVYRRLLSTTADVTYSSQYMLSEMYAIIFNGCFPANFRSDVRMQIWRLRQGEKMVREYVYELHQLYTMLGDESDRNKVIKLWEGFNTDL